jgi:titin
LTYFNTATGIGNTVSFGYGTNANTVTGLVNGNVYLFTVTAQNAAGNSTVGVNSNAYATPFTVPDPIILSSVVSGSAKVAVSWNEPYNSGNAIVAYYLTYFNTATGIGNTVSFGYGTNANTVTGLVNGNVYLFTVTAQNAAGNSAVAVGSNAYATPFTVPDPIVLSSIVSSNAKAVVSWNTPYNKGNSIVAYYLTYFNTATGIGNTVSFGYGTNANTVTGLVNGNVYLFTVTAKNAAGNSAVAVGSNAYATPFTVPDPIVLSSVVSGSAKVAVSWNEPYNSGNAIVGYYLTYFNTATRIGNTVSFGYGTNANTVTGLVNGNVYLFTVTAKNAAGNSAVAVGSNAYAIPFTVPDPIVLSSVVSGNTKVAVSWNTPYNEGNSIVAYYLTYFNTATGIGNTVSFGYGTNANTVTGLVNGNVYLFTVTAQNAAGNSAVGVNSNAYATPFTVPDPIVLSSVVSGNTKVAVSWNEPYNSGNAIVGYYLTYFNTATGIINTVSFGYGTNANTVTGLVNGNVYLFTVTAKNAAGNSAVAVGSNAYATPYTVTLPIVISSVVPNNATVYVTWDEPYNSGNPIVAYNLTYFDTNTEISNNIIVEYGTNAYTVTGLTNGHVYLFTLTAQNAAGNSAVSVGSNAYATPFTIPDPIVISSVVSSNEAIDISWNTPNNEGNPITSYNLTYSDTNTGIENTLYIGYGKNAYTVTGLVNGHVYLFILTAQNAAGISVVDVNSYAYATPYTVPVPIVISSVIPNNATVDLTWNEPYNSGNPIVAYNLTYFNTDTKIGNTISLEYGTNEYIVTELINGNVYLFTVTAQNAAGNSAVAVGSNAYATPYTIPESVVFNTSSTIAGNSKVSLFWNAPFNNGNTITAYYVTYYNMTYNTNNIVVLSGTTLNTTISNLINGNLYIFNIEAYNEAGSSLISTLSNTSVIPYTIPNSPLSLSATSGNTSVSLTWSKPTFNGGNTITAYNLYNRTISTIVPVYSGLLLSNTVTGLVNGNTYIFYVTAQNMAGNSRPSANVSSIPYTVPSAVTNVNAVSLDSAVQVNWSTPLSIGGNAITYYNIYYGSSSLSYGNALLSTVSVSYAYSSNTITGLTNGLSYVFYVVAQNAAGISIPVTTPIITPLSVPSGVNLTGVAGTTSDTLYWSETAYNGGSAVTAYNLTRNGSNIYSGIPPVSGNVVITPKYYYTFNQTDVSGTLILNNATGLGLFDASLNIGNLISSTSKLGNGSLSLTNTSNISSILNSSNTPSSFGAIRVSGLAVSGDQTRILVSSQGGDNAGLLKLYIKTAGTWGTAQSTLQTSQIDGYTALSCVKLSQDGNRGVTVSNNPGCAYYFTWNGSNYSTFTKTLDTIPRYYYGLAMTPDGSKIFVTASLQSGKPLNYQGVFYATWNGSNYTAFTQILGNSNIGYSGNSYTNINGINAGIACTADGSKIIYSSNSNQLKFAIWNSTYNNYVESVNTFTSSVTPSGALTVTSDGNTLFIGTINNRIYYTTWNPSTNNYNNAVSYFKPILTGNDIWWGLELSRDDSTLYASSQYSNTLQYISAPYTPSYVSLPASISIPSTGLSFATWIKPSGLNGTIFELANGATSDNIIFGITNRYLTATVYYDSTPYTITDTTTAISTGSWSHVAWTITNTTPPNWSLFVNGYTVVNTYLNTIYPNSVVRSLNYIGKSTISYYTPYYGYIDDFRIYYNTLRQADIFGLYGNISTSLTQPIYSYTDISLNTGTSYIYSITVQNARGNSVSAYTTLTPYTVPVPIVISSVVPSNATVDISWNEPYNSGSSIVAYYLTYFNTATRISNTITVGYGTNANTVTGLVNGNVYLFTVTAQNAAGNSAVGVNSNAYASPYTVPDPILLSSVVSGNTKVSVNWNTPYNKGNSILAYYLTYFNTATGIENTVSFDYGTNANTVTGLVNGNVYLFTVTSQNAAGNSAVAIGSNAYATPYTVPEPIVISSVIPNNAIVDLTWNEPFNSGNPIVAYNLTYLDTNTGIENTVTLNYGTNAYRVTGLTNGHVYLFTLTAQNAAGISSVGVNSTAYASFYSVPDPIVISSVVSINEAIDISWNEPYNFGNPIVTYNLTYLDINTGIENTVAIEYGTNAYTVTGLVNGQVYLFTLTAQNAAGNSEVGINSTAYATPYTVPEPIIIYSVIPNNTTVDLTWNEPYNEGNPIVAYNLTYFNTDTKNENTISLEYGTNAYTVAELVNGNVYLFTVTAQNAAGNSAVAVGSNAFATPFTIPDSVVFNTDSTIVGNSEVSLFWNAPFNNGNTITAYYVTYYNMTYNTNNIVVLSETTLTTTISDLINGNLYIFNIVATNAAGSSLISTASNTSVTPYTIPNSPLSLSATYGNTSIYLTWLTPTLDGGNTITAYNLYNSTISTTVPVYSGLLLSNTVTGLVNGNTYVFYVTAQNIAGNSYPSDNVSSIPYTVPSAVTNVNAISLDSAVQVNWSTPLSIGGNAITYYNIYYGSSSLSYGNALLSTVSVSYVYSSNTITGLTNGLSYVFYVVAQNAAGISIPVTTPIITPLAVPSAVTLYGVAGTTTDTLYWSETSYNGGSAVTAYNLARNGSNIYSGIPSFSGNIVIAPKYYYTFNQTDVSGTLILNNATGLDVFDATLNSENLISSTSKLGNGSLSLTNTSNISSILDSSNTPSSFSVNRVSGLAVSGDQTRILVSSQGGANAGLLKLYIKTAGTWGTAQSTLQTTTNDEYTSLSCVKLSQDGTRGVALSNNPGYAYYFTWNGSNYSTFTKTLDDIPRFYWGLAMTPDGSKIFATASSQPGQPLNYQGVFYATWNGSNYTEFTQILGSSDIGYSLNSYSNINGINSGIACTADGSKIIYTSAANPLYFATWNSTYNNYVESVNTFTSEVSPFGGLTVTSDGNTLFIGTANERIYYTTWNPSTNNYNNAVSYFNPIPNGSDAWWGVELSRDDSTLYASSQYSNTLYYISAPYNASYVSLPASISIPSTGLSFTAWIKPSGLNGTIFDLANGETSDNIIFGITNRYLTATVYYGSTPYTITDTTTAISSDSWSHVAWTITNSSPPNWSLFVNGYAVVNTYLNTMYPSSVVRLLNYIGKSTISYYTPYYGYIDDFRIYYNTLRPTDISGLYGNVILTSYTQPVYIYTDISLNTGTSYIYSITVQNARGNSVSAYTTLTPYTFPEPIVISSVVPSNATVDISWNEPYNYGSSIVAYYLTYFNTATGIENTVSFDYGTNANTVTGLVNGNVYLFTVTAQNAAGNSAVSVGSNAYATPFTVPDPINNLLLSSGDKTVTLSWSPPYNEGDMITYYNIFYGLYGTVFGDPLLNVMTYPYTSTNVTISSLSNGTDYIFYITAQNSAGNSIPVNQSITTNNYIVPDPVTFDTSNTIVRNSSIYLTWFFPYDQGSPITAYYITYYNMTYNTSNTISVSGMTSNVTINNLINGNLYIFNITAQNSAGNSIITTLSNTYATTYTIPDPVNILTSYASGSNSVSLTWSEPFNEGSPILAYYLTYFNTSTGISNIVSFSYGTNSNTVTGLVNGNVYLFSINAQNAAGNSILATSSNTYTTPYGIPDTVSNVTLTNISNGSVSLQWSAPYNQGNAITAYYVTYYNGASLIGINAFGSGVNSTTINGLVNGNLYVFTVTARNAAGNSIVGVNSNVYATPYTAPFSVRNANAVAGNTTVKVNWTAPSSNGGNTVTYYIYYGLSIYSIPNPNLTLVTFNSSITSNTITGLTNGSNYVFYIIAHNNAGNSVTNSVYSTPYTIPNPVIISSVTTPSSQQVNVYWTAPIDGGSSITNYYFTTLNTYSGNTSSVSLPFGSSFNFCSGLVNGNVYVFTITAKNAAGNSLIGGNSQAYATPYGVPDTMVTSIPFIGNSTVVVNWNEPFNQGNAITRYYLAIYDGTITNTVSFPYGINSNTVTRLTNGTNYRFHTISRNAAGNSLQSPYVYATPYTIPDFVSISSVVSGNTKVVVNWTAPTFTGGNAITGYYVNYYNTADGNTSSVLVPKTITSNTVTGLINGNVYLFTVTAQNAAGNSLIKGNSQAYATPYTIPDPVNNITLTNIGNSTVSLQWSAPYNEGNTITDYYVRYYNGASLIGINASGSVNSNTITGLVNGNLYVFTVIARNNAGNSMITQNSNVYATPYTVPNVVTNANVAPLNASAQLNWSIPSFNGGNAITYYNIYYGLNGNAYGSSNLSTVTVNSSYTSNIVTGLMNGPTYVFYIVAQNNAGNSGPTTLSTIPYTVPNPVIIANLTASSTKVVVNWSAPTNNGGNTITGYYLNYYNTVTGNTATFLYARTVTGNTVTGLINGNVYLFTVTARNTAGNSLVGVGSNAYATPFTIPDPVTITTPIVTGNATAIVNWIEPYNRGNTITRYYLTYYNTYTGIQNTNSILYGTNSNTVTGLVNGNVYLFSITARNYAGNSLPTIVSNAYATPFTVPDSPISLSVIQGYNSITVNWSEPFNEGNTITSYNVYNATLSTTIPVFTGYAFSNTVTGLVGGNSYVFYVTAQNSAGNSAPSSISGIPLVLTIPDIPTNVTATSGDKVITVSWSPPLTDGGIPINSYYLYNATLSTTIPIFSGYALSNTVTGLALGNSYVFYVTAQNTLGNSAPSVNVNATVYSAPTPPSPIDSIVTIGNVMLAWSVPTFDGGSPITNYNVYNTSVSTTVPVYSGTALTTSFSGLVTDSSYTFIITAQNIYGNSTPLQTTLTPNTINNPLYIPSPSYFTTKISGNTSTYLEWIAPDNNTIYSVSSYNITRNGTSIYNGNGTLSGNTTTLKPQFYYAFNKKDISGNKVYNSSTKTYDAKTIGSASISNWNYLELNGGYVQLPSITTNTNGMSFLFWLYPLSDGIIFELANGPTNDNITLYLHYESDRNFYLYFTVYYLSIPYNVKLTSTNFSRYSNYHIGLTLSDTYPSVWSFYVNGSLVSTFTTNTIYPRAITRTLNYIAYSSNPYYTSLYGDPSYVSINGSFDNFYMYNNLLQPSEVSNVFNTQSYPNDVEAPILRPTYSYYDTGLSYGTTYTYSITTQNAYGNSTFFDYSAPVIPVVIQGFPPGSPLNFQATAGYTTSVQLSWNAPSTGGNVDTYAISYGTTGTAYGSSSLTIFTVPYTITANTVTGLLYDTSYVFYIISKNIYGNSSPVQSTATPTNPLSLVKTPSAPIFTNAIGTNGDSSGLSNGLVLCWCEPFNTNGSAVTYYNIYRNGSYISNFTGSPETNSIYTNSIYADYIYSTSILTSVGEGFSIMSTLNYGGYRYFSEPSSGYNYSSNPTVVNGVNLLNQSKSNYNYDATVSNNAIITSNPTNVYLPKNSYIQLPSITTDTNGLTFQISYSFDTSGTLFEFSNGGYNDNISMYVEIINSSTIKLFATVYNNSVPYTVSTPNTNILSTTYQTSIYWILSNTSPSLWTIAINGSSVLFTSANTYYPNQITRTMNYIGKSNISSTLNYSGNFYSFQIYKQYMSVQSLNNYVSKSQYKYIDSGLVNGNTYNYSISAHNSFGNSIAANFSLTLPGIPTNIRANAIGYTNSFNLSWNPPLYGSDKVTGYFIHLTPSIPGYPNTTPSTTTSQDITFKINYYQKYTCTISSFTKNVINKDNQESAGVDITLIPPREISFPVINFTSVTAGDGTATLNWKQPIYWDSNVFNYDYIITNNVIGSFILKSGATIGSYTINSNYSYIFNSSNISGLTILNSASGSYDATLSNISIFTNTNITIPASSVDYIRLPSITTNGNGISFFIRIAPLNYGHFSSGTIFELGNADSSNNIVMSYDANTTMLKTTVYYDSIPYTISTSFNPTNTSDIGWTMTNTTPPIWMININGSQISSTGMNTVYPRIMTRNLNYIGKSNTSVNSFSSNINLFFIYYTPLNASDYSSFSNNTYSVTRQTYSYTDYGSYKNYNPLVNGTTYNYTIQCSNSYGNSVAGTSVSVTPHA